MPQHSRSEYHPTKSDITAKGNTTRRKANTTEKALAIASAFSWPARRDTAAQMRVLHPCGAAAADFVVKNSPPDCFFTPLTLLGFKSLRTEKEHTAALRQCALFLARPKGFEPPIFRIGICCVIQLRHGRILRRTSVRLFCFF